VTELPVIADGMVSVGAKPGLGIELLPEVVKRKDAIVRHSAV